MKAWAWIFFGVPAIVLVVAGLVALASLLWELSPAVALVVGWALFSGFVAYMAEITPADCPPW